MKKVSFNVAKAIKEAGYPQYGFCNDYYNSEGLIVSKFCKMDKLVFPAPTYLEVWLWLWREKKRAIELRLRPEGWMVLTFGVNAYYADPEEAIIAAIEHLAENNLIK